MKWGGDVPCGSSRAPQEGRPAPTASVLVDLGEGGEVEVWELGRKVPPPTPQRRRRARGSVARLVRGREDACECE